MINLMKFIIFLLLVFIPFFITEEKVGKDEIEEEKITLYFVGDIMLDRGVLHYIKKNNNWSWSFLKIADELEKADLVFGNLESMISDKGHDLGGLYSFRAPPETLQGLIDSHFDIVSVANNHSFDYGVQAFSDTLERLEKANILYMGGGFDKEEAHSVKIKDIYNTKIGFLGYTSVGSPGWQAKENIPGIAWIDINSLDILRRDIQKAKQESDILIVSFHFGIEYKKEPSQEQIILAESALDYGADIIVGHHPHVVQSLEKKEQGIIAYSLGNFIFDQYFSQETMQGAILRVIIKDKKIIQAELLKTQLNSEYQVFLDNKLDPE